MKETTKNQVIHFFGSNLDVIISDMAADTTGNKSLDRLGQIFVLEGIKFSKNLKRCISFKSFYGGRFHRG